MSEDNLSTEENLQEESPKEVISTKHVALKRFIAEMLGTAILVIIGCGAVMGLSYNGASNIGLAIGGAFAFGLVVTALSYALGEFSGCHLNPAVSFAMLLDHKIGLKQFAQYVGAQFIGGLIGGAVLLLIFGTRVTGNEVVDTLASNATNLNTLYGTWVGGDNVPSTAYSKEGWPFMFIALFAEVFFALVFVFTILCTSHKKANGPISGIALGLSLVSIVFLGFNITGTSVNPARSLGTAVFACVKGQYEPIKQIWIFFVGPMLGAYLAVLAYHAIFHDQGAHIEPEIKAKNK